MATVILSRSGRPRRIVPLNEVRENAREESAYADPSQPFRRLVAELQGDDRFAQELLSFLTRNQGQRTLVGSLERTGDAGVLPQAPPRDDPEWIASNGLLYHGTLAYLPAPARGEAMRSNHDDPHAGHFGYLRTLEALRCKYYWPGMAKDVEEYTRTSNACARTKTTRHQPYGQLQSLPAPEGLWKGITMDFITDLPPSSRSGTAYDSELVVVDQFSKMAQYIPTQKTLDAAGLAKLFYERIWRNYGVPSSIVTDRGTQFTSRFWSAFCYQLDVKRRLSTAFHTQTDDQTERQNQTLEQYLRSYINYQQDDWVEWLGSAEFAYNNSVHSVTKYTPFFLARAEHPLIGDEVKRSDCKVPAVESRIEAMQKIRKDLTGRWQEAVAKQAEYYNAKHKPIDFAVDDMVWLSGRNIHTIRPSKKLDYKYYGPYRVADAIGTQAYRLDLPAGTKIHPVFHVSLLEPYRTGEGRGNTGALPLRVAGDSDPIVARILVSKLHYGKLRYLVSYEDRGDIENERVAAEETERTRALQDLVAEFHKRCPAKADLSAEGR